MTKHAHPHNNTGVQMSNLVVLPGGHVQQNLAGDNPAGVYARQADELAAMVEGLIRDEQERHVKTLQTLQVVAKSLGEQHGELDALANQLAVQALLAQVFADPRGNWMEITRAQYLQVFDAHGGVEGGRLAPRREGDLREGDLEVFELTVDGLREDIAGGPLPLIAGGDQVGFHLFWPTPDVIATMACGCGVPATVMCHGMILCSACAGLVTQASALAGPRRRGGEVR